MPRDVASPPPARSSRAEINAWMADWMAANTTEGSLPAFTVAALVDQSDEARARREELVRRQRELDERYQAVLRFREQCAQRKRERVAANARARQARGDALAAALATGRKCSVPRHQPRQHRAARRCTPARGSPCQQEDPDPERVARLLRWRRA